MSNINFKYLEVVKLNFDNGTNGKFKFLDLIELNEKKYIVLLPDGGKGDIVHIFRLENMESKSTLRYLPVEDKDVENIILDTYNKGKHNYLNKKAKSKMLIFICFIILTIAIPILLVHEYTFMETSELHDEQYHARMITPSWEYMTDNSTDVTFKYRQYGDMCTEVKIAGYNRLRCDPFEVLSWYTVPHNTK